MPTPNSYVKTLTPNTAVFGDRPFKEIIKVKRSYEGGSGVLIRKGALAGWFSWLEHHPVQQKVMGSIPGQGTYLGSGFDPQVGYVWEATDHCFPLTLMVLSFLPLSLKPINLLPGGD